MNPTTFLVLLFSCNSEPEETGVDPCSLDTDDDGLTDCQEESHWHTDPNKADSDSDGLGDWDEVNTLETDPNNPDSDGDSYSDGDEYNKFGTSPTNEFSHPYIGDYNVGDCAAYPDKATAHPTGSRIVETGGGGGTKVALYEPGDTVQNFQMIDQYGEMVDLYSFCGKFVDIFFFQWNEVSGPPEYSALSCWINDMKNVHTYYRDYGYELIVVLTQKNQTELVILVTPYIVKPVDSKKDLRSPDDGLEMPSDAERILLGRLYKQKEPGEGNIPSSPVAVEADRPRLHGPAGYILK